VQNAFPSLLGLVSKRALRKRNPLYPIAGKNRKRPSVKEQCAKRHGNAIELSPADKSTTLPYSWEGKKGREGKPFLGDKGERRHRGGKKRIGCPFIAVPVSIGTFAVMKGEKRAKQGEER